MKMGARVSCGFVCGGCAVSSSVLTARLTAATSVPRGESAAATSRYDMVRKRGEKSEEQFVGKVNIGGAGSACMFVATTGEGWSSRDTTGRAVVRGGVAGRESGKNSAS